MICELTEFWKSTEKTREHNDLSFVYRCCFCAMLFSAMVFAQAPRLTLDPVNINGNAGQVTFTVFPPTSLSSSATIQNQYSYETLDHKYLVVVDPGTIAVDSKFGIGDLSFETRIKRLADGNWYSYNVRASPTGNFADLMKDVNFTVADGSHASTVLIKLPLHSNAYGEALQWIKDDSPIMQMKVSDIQGPTIALHNSLENLSIHVTKLVIRRNCYQCWQESQAQPIDLTIPPSGKVFIPLNIRPKPLSALLSTASTLKRDAAQDRLSLLVDYSVDYGGVPKQKQFDLPVRFSPSFWHLTIVIIAGALLGIVLRSILEKLPWRPLLKTIGHMAMTIFLTCIAIGLLVAVASYDSKLVILGLDLDPRQMIPAFIVAGLIAGGSTVRKWAAGIIQLGRGQKDAAAAAGAGGG